MFGYTFYVSIHPSKDMLPKLFICTLTFGTVRLLSLYEPNVNVRTTTIQHTTHTIYSVRMLRGPNKQLNYTDGFASYLVSRVHSRFATQHIVVFEKSSTSLVYHISCCCDLLCTAHIYILIQVSSTTRKYTSINSSQNNPYH